MKVTKMDVEDGMNGFGSYEIVKESKKKKHERL